MVDESRRPMLLCGGGSATGWALSPDRPRRWSLVTTTGMAPPELSGHSALYDPARDRMLILEYDRWRGCERLARSTRGLALRLGGALRRTDVRPVGAEPESRRAHTTVFDPRFGRLLPSGGLNRSYPLLGGAWILSTDPEFQRARLEWDRETGPGIRSDCLTEIQLNVVAAAPVPGGVRVRWEPSGDDLPAQWIVSRHAEEGHDAGAPVAVTLLSAARSWIDATPSPGPLTHSLEAIPRVGGSGR